MVQRTLPHPSESTFGCPDCGLLQWLPAPVPGTILECARCGHGLGRPAASGVDVPLAFSAAALVLLIPAAFAPLMSLVSFGMQRRNWLPTGIEALWGDGFGALAVVVCLFSMAIPFAYLGLMVFVLGSARLRPPAPLGTLFRWAGQLRPWAMLEVYLVGCCVAYTRLQDVGNVHINAGGWCLMGAAFAALLAAVTLDERAVWAALACDAVTARSGQTISCDVCELLVDATAHRGYCMRCGAGLHFRKPDSLLRTLALVVAGFLLYLPANLYPVLDIERFGHEEPNTILGGVKELLENGLWPLAAIVFTASILVPLLKLCGLTMMLLMTHRRSQRWLIARTRLYRFIDFIGRWSSIDLFMISILVALVQFGALTSIKPQAGAVAFAAVVILTMLASSCFDPRVMWDVADGAA